MVTRITVSEETKRMLENLKEPNESLEDVILSLGMDDFEDEDDEDEE